MKFLNKIKDKFLENYHSKSFTKWLVFFSCVLIPLCFFFRFLYLNKELLSWQNGWWVIVLVLIIAIIFAWLLLKWIIDLFFLSSYKIEDNMEKLPQNVWSEKLLVQYSLPKDITPSEVGMLMYGRAEISNMLCLIYKWINEKKIVLYVENGKKFLKRIQCIDVLYCDYEKFLFNKLFSGDWPILFDKKLLEQFLWPFNDMLAGFCMRKWYIDNKINMKAVKYFLMSRDSGLGNKVIVERNASMWCLLFVFLFPWFAIASNLGWLWSLVWIVLFLAILAICYNNKKYYIHLTDKGKDVISKIYWYKYYLEHCEEELINSDLEEGEIYSKHLPYAIALKLNWKIIDKLS